MALLLEDTVFGPEGIIPISATRYLKVLQGTFYSSFKKIQVRILVFISRDGRRM
jgi:hypothetical protein